MNEFTCNCQLCVLRQDCYTYTYEGRHDNRHLQLNDLNIVDDANHDSVDFSPEYYESFNEARAEMGLEPLTIGEYNERNKASISEVAGWSKVAKLKEKSVPAKFFWLPLGIYLALVFWLGLNLFPEGQTFQQDILLAGRVVILTVALFTVRFFLWGVKGDADSTLARRMMIGLVLGIPTFCYSYFVGNHLDYEADVASRFEGTSCTVIDVDSYGGPGYEWIEFWDERPDGYFKLSFKETPSRSPERSFRVKSEDTWHNLETVLADVCN